METPKTSFLASRLKLRVSQMIMDEKSHTAEISLMDEINLSDIILQH